MNNPGAKLPPNLVIHLPNFLVEIALMDFMPHVVVDCIKSIKQLQPAALYRQ